MWQKQVPKGGSTRLDEEARLTELSVLYEMLSIPTSLVDLAEVLDLVLDKATRLLNTEIAVAYILGEGKLELHARAARGIRKEKAASIKIRPGEGVIGRAIDEGTLIIVTSEQKESMAELPLTDRYPIKAALCVPIKTRAEIVGLIYAARLFGQKFTLEEVPLFTTLANRAGLAIENAKLYGEAQWRLQELARLSEASQAVTSSLDLEDVLAKIVSLAGKVADSAITGVVLVEDGKLGASFQDFQGIPPLHARARPHGFTMRLITTGEPVVINEILSDGSTEPPVAGDGGAIKANPVVVKAGLKSLAGLPIAVKGKVVGVLFVHSFQPHVFRDKIPLLTTFASQAAIAIENARLFEEERRRATQLTLINEVGDRAASILDLDKLMPEVTRYIQEKFDYYNVALFLLDEERHEVVMQAVAGGFEHITPGEYRQSIDEGIMGFVARTGKSWLANDVSKDPYYVKGFLGEVLTKSELCVPIKLGDEVLGALDAQCIRLNAFDQSDVTAMEAVADQLAIAIQNARLYEETRRHSERLAQTLAVSELLHRDLELEQLLEQIAQGAARLGFRRAVINVRQPKEELARVRAVAGLEGPEREKLMGATYRWSDFQLLTQERFQVSRSYLIRQGEVDWEKDFQGIIVAPSREDRGPGYWRPEDALLVPLWGTNGQSLGLLSVDEPVDGLLPDLNTIQTLEAFANQAAIAIENARLFEETSQRALQLQTIEEVGRRVSSILDLDELLPYVAKAIQHNFGYYHVDVFLVDQATGYAVFKASNDPAMERVWKEQGFRLKVGEEGMIGWVAHTGEALLANDVSQEPNYLPDELLPETRSELVVPLKVEGRVVGVLDANSDKLNAFDEHDIFILQTLAGQAAIAIENARLYEAAQRELAERKRAERLLQALNQAAIAMERALTPEEIFAAVAEELKKLGFVCVVLLTDEGQSKLFLKYFSYKGGAVKAAEKLVGLKAEDLSIPIETVDTYRKVVWERKAILVENVEEVVRQLLPGPAKRFARQIAKMLKVSKSIAAPLMVEDKAIGLISVQSDDLTEDDIPAITAFAHQMAAAWRKAKLLQDLERSLKELKQTQAQLIQAGKLAAIGQLVAGVAHELNNPLTSVVGYSQLLLGADCSEEIKQDLERINRQALRAARVVENLLTFARRREPRKESININDVIEKSLELQAHQLELDRISIVRELDEALPPAMADPFQMQQVFMNIISNAHQALRDWEGERELRVKSKLAGDMVRLEFADTGPGLPPEIMERLFEPFFTTREVGEGTGLGLSISYGIVEAHGGRIWAESKVGKGATFIVEIPVKGD